MADNSKVCDVAVRVVGRSIDPLSLVWIPKQHRGRCMEHSLHCATRAFLEAIAPTPIHLIKKKLAAGKNKTIITDSDDMLDDDEEEEDDPIVYTDEDKDDLEMDDDTSVNTDFDPKDLLGKILAFVNQVRSSPQARAYFKKLCQEENVNELQLLKWIRTRWASLYDLIICLLDVQPVCADFVIYLLLCL
jgi:hypothetical protein